MVISGELQPEMTAQILQAIPDGGVVGGTAVGTGSLPPEAAATMACR